jgi:glycosyltransferase involved in cell wall biosynthesis
MSTIVVNCRKVPFASTLGVAHFLLRTCEQLTDRHDLVFVVPELDEFERSPAATTIRAMASDVVEPTDGSLLSGRARAIELLPHHFQAPDFCDRSIVVCHDLHVFDIAWKYGDRATAMQQTFRRVLQTASAVITHFPRTYYDVERTAGITLPNLFLTPSPLLLDTRASFGQHPDNERFTLMFPAQLQAHKNHLPLIESVGRLVTAGRSVRLLLPGTDFESSLSDEITSRVQASGLEDDVRLLGRIDDDALVELYGNVDAVVVPSAAEGGAYVPLEAIAAGRPVAVNRIESAQRHLAAMRAKVVWFDVDDPASIDAAVIDLIEGDRSVHADANAVTRRLIGATDWGTVADVLDTVIQMLMGRRSRPRLRVDRVASSIQYV